jgi:hypothetical protein
MEGGFFIAGNFVGIEAVISPAVTPVQQEFANLVHARFPGAYFE